MKNITNKTDFTKEVIEEKNKPVLVDFYADWCGPCKMLAPIIEQFAQKNPNVKVVKVNVDEASDIASEYGIMSIPTIHIFHQGKAVKQFVGLQDQKTLEKAVKNLSA